jgi:hypothetical protein
VSSFRVDDSEDTDDGEPDSLEGSLVEAGNSSMPSANSFHFFNKSFTSIFDKGDHSQILSNK